MSRRTTQPMTSPALTGKRADAQRTRNVGRSFEGEEPCAVDNNQVTRARPQRPHLPLLALQVWRHVATTTRRSGDHEEPAATPVAAYSCQGASSRPRGTRRGPACNAARRQVLSVPVAARDSASYGPGDGGFSAEQAAASSSHRGQGEEDEFFPTKRTLRIRRVVSLILVVLLLAAPLTWLILQRSSATNGTVAGSLSASPQPARPTSVPSLSPAQPTFPSARGEETEPLLRQFVTSAGFGGICAVLAAVLTFLYSRAKDRKQHWWENLTWVYDRAVVEKEKRDALPRQAATEALRALLASSSTRRGRAWRRVIRYYGGKPQQSPQEALISALYPAMSTRSPVTAAEPAAATTGPADSDARASATPAGPEPSSPRARGKSVLVEYRQPGAAWSPTAELQSASLLAAELAASGDLRSRGTLAGVYERLALNALAGLAPAFHDELENMIV